MSTTEQLFGFTSTVRHARRSEVWILNIWNKVWNLNFRFHQKKQTKNKFSLCEPPLKSNRSEEQKKTNMMLRLGLISVLISTFYFAAPTFYVTSWKSIFLTDAGFLSYLYSSLRSPICGWCLFFVRLLLCVCDVADTKCTTSIKRPFGFHHNKNASIWLNYLFIYVLNLIGMIECRHSQHRFSKISDWSALKVTLYPIPCLGV